MLNGVGLLPRSVGRRLRESSFQTAFGIVHLGWAVSRGSIELLQVGDFSHDTIDRPLKPLRILVGPDLSMVYEVNLFEPPAKLPLGDLAEPVIFVADRAIFPEIALIGCEAFHEL